MSKHTAGPWTLERVPIGSGGGSNTCFKIGPFQACIYDDWRPREAGITEEQQVANARLIASAPALLEALKEAEAALQECAEMMGEAGWGSRADNATRTASKSRAAIAQAEKGAGE